MTEGLWTCGMDWHGESVQPHHVGSLYGTAGSY